MLIIDRLEIEASESLELVVARVRFAPGDATGYALLHRPVLLVVERGSLTWYPDGDCDAWTFSTGSTFVRADPGDGLLRNEGSSDAEAIVTFVAPRAELPHRHDVVPAYEKEDHE
jgi:hypothetical protein